MQYDRIPIDLEHPKNTSDFLVLLTGSNKKVLGIGPLFRQVSKILKERGCINTIIDTNLEFTDLENGIEWPLTGDIDSLDLEKTLGSEKFDVILLDNVLECVREPTKLLEKLQKFLSENGSIVCAISNIAHASTRIMLLNGGFRYSSDTLLNKKHIRFFTLDTILLMTEEAKYSLTNMYRVKEEFNLLNCTDLNYNTIPQELVEAILKDPESTTINYVFMIVPSSNSKINSLNWSLGFSRDITTERLKEIFHYYKENLIGVLEQKIREQELQIVQMQTSSNKFKKIVDETYVEILQRHADQQGLEYYADLIENKKITRDQLREILVESEEYKSLHKNIPK